MKKCIVCYEMYPPKGREKSCSLKCKLLSNIEKIENGCWIWKGNKGGDYGKVRFNMKFISTHRASYITFKGEVPDGKWVCHNCDNPLCINPDHLFVGSPSENRKDAVKKGRIPIGENNHLHKFTDAQVFEMRKLKKDKFSYYRLSRIFNCSVAYLVSIIKNKLRIG